MNLGTIFTHCITGIDGETVDPARVYGGAAVAVFLGLAIYSVVWNKAAWDAGGFGIGFGSLLLGFGIGVKVKASTEPEENKGGGT